MCKLRASVLTQPTTQRVCPGAALATRGIFLVPRFLSLGTPPGGSSTPSLMLRQWQEDLTEKPNQPKDDGKRGTQCADLSIRTRIQKPQSASPLIRCHER